MAKYDLYNLPDDVLFLSKQSFYDFVGQVCGPMEANLLQIQGIQNPRSLIRCSNLFSILDIDCEEVDKLKPSICFISKTGKYFVRQGVQLNLDNLCDALKEKHDMYKKKKHRVVISSSIPTPQTTNSNDCNNLFGQNLSGTTTDTLPNVSLTSTNSNPSPLPSTCISIYDHARFIQDLIEKFSNKTFTSTLLKPSEHYELMITQDEQKFKAMIKCQCGAKMVLPSRFNTKTFILSNYYSHLLTTNCSMVQKIKKQEKDDSPTVELATYEPRHLSLDS